MSAWRPAAAAVLLTLAVVVALLAADVRSWGESLASGDAVYAAAPARAEWAPSARVGSLAERLLGVRADLASREALKRYAATAGVQARLDNALSVQSGRARAQDALEGVARDANPRRAAQARTLLGVLALRSSARGSEQGQVDAAASDFADAIRVDPSADEAKFDLELLLRLSAARGSRPGRESGAGTGQTGRHGAGAGTPGTGY